MSGLTMGLLSLGETQLEILSKAGMFETIIILNLRVGTLCAMFETIIILNLRELLASYAFPVCLQSGFHRNHIIPYPTNFRGCK